MNNAFWIKSFMIIMNVMGEQISGLPGLVTRKT